MNRSYKNARLNNVRRPNAGNSRAGSGLPINPQQAYARQRNAAMHSNAASGLPINPQQAYTRQRNAITPLAAPDIQVYDEPSLINAVFNAPTGVPYVIELMDDIQLLAPLEILSYTEITLTGDYSLFGADGYETVSVQADAILTLDGITVTHMLGEGGRGVTNSGTFTLLSGAISGNTVIGDGGGVYSLEPVFIMGGEISDNTATLNGGGLYILNDSITASTLQDCLIYGNIAENGNGGGIYAGGTAPRLYIRSIVPITMILMRNTALNGDGGAIWIAYEDLDQLFAEEGVIFTENQSSAGYFMEYGVDITTHFNNILTHVFSTPFAYAYNNFDISYTYGEIAVNLYGVAVNDSYAIPSGAGFHIPGETVTIYAGSNPGYTFAGWAVDSGGAVLDNPSSETTTFTMPYNAVSVTAYWTPLGASTFAVTLNGGGNGSSGAGDHEPATTVNINAGTRPGYTFMGWTVDLGGAVLANPGAAATSFTMPENPVVLTANWASNLYEISSYDELYEAALEAAAGIEVVFEIRNNIVYQTLLGYPVQAIAITAGKNITLVSSGNYTLTTQGNYRHFNVAGELTMENGVTLSNYNPAQNGGGIEVTGGGEFTMNGGAIYGNRAQYGGGVYVEGIGIFTMTGGEIFANRALAGGGVLNVGLFTMAGGSIVYGNPANRNRGGLSPLDAIVIEGGDIHDNLADNGGGVYSLEPVLIVGGEIYDNTATLNGGGVYIENESGIPSVIEDCLIYGNTAQTGDGGGIYAGGTTPALDITGVTVITVNSAPLGDGGAIWIDYAALDQLTAGADVFFAGNAASEGYFMTDAGDITLHGANILANDFSYPFSYGYNNFDISYTLGDLFVEPDDTVVFRGTKEATGAQLAAGMFEFGLFDDLGDLIATTVNDGFGNIIFPPMVFDTVGTYNFTIRELTEDENGWVADTTVFPAVVTVSLIGADINAEVSYPSGEPLFSDSFEPEECGLIEFPAITFTEPGVYEFTFRELTPSGDGWITDGRDYRVIVTVTDEDGVLVASLEYPDGFPTFENRYEPTQVQVIVSGTKLAIGADLICGMFEFGLFDDEGNLVASTVNGPVITP